MESLDTFRERFDALEQQTVQLMQHTHRIERRLRWWRGTALLLLVLGLISWPLSGTITQAQDEPVIPQALTLEQRVAALENKLVHVTRSGTNLFITGANLHLRNGLNNTSTKNGLGNLIVGYNEPRSSGPNTRTGSHTVVIGREHNFSSFGGLVLGRLNTISGAFAAVSGGVNNRATGIAASVSGGELNMASGVAASVSGGGRNQARGITASVSGGEQNVVDGVLASASGGYNNQPDGKWSSVAGGFVNQAVGEYSSICGGNQNRTTGTEASISGGFSNVADGQWSSVTGGINNVASGLGSSVSGGRNRTASGDFDWVAGLLFADE